MFLDVALVELGHCTTMPLRRLRLVCLAPRLTVLQEGGHQVASNDVTETGAACSGMLRFLDVGAERHGKNYLAC